MSCVPLARIVSATIPSGSGKDHEKKPLQKRKAPPSRNISNYDERVPPTSSSAERETSHPYEVVLVKDTSATTRYGCKGRVREKSSDLPPPHPYDIFISHDNEGFFVNVGRPSFASQEIRKWYTIIQRDLVSPWQLKITSLQVQMSEDLFPKQISNCFGGCLA